MTKTIAFTVYGEPVPKLRARTFFHKQAQRVVTMTPKKTVEYEESIRSQARQHRPVKLMEGPLIISMKVYRSIPKSITKKKRAFAVDGSLRPISRPDLDNYIKSVKDALNGIIWRDDSQIVRIFAEKFYSENPRIEFDVAELGPTGRG